MLELKKFNNFSLLKKRMKQKKINLIMTILNNTNLIQHLFNKKMKFQ